MQKVQCSWAPFCGHFLTNPASQDTEIDISELGELILAVGSTLESLAIRQAGAITDDESTTFEDFRLSDLPRLERLALALNEGIPMPLAKFKNVNLKYLELGTEGEGELESVCALLEGGSWTPLKQVGFSSLNIDSVAWSRIHDVCGRRGISFDPGFTKDLDWPFIA